jgi:hypothetical protein
VIFTFEKFEDVATGACPQPMLGPCGKVDPEAASPAGPESSIVPLAPTPLSGEPLLEPAPLPLVPLAALPLAPLSPAPLPPMPLLAAVPLPAAPGVEPLAAPELTPEL